MKLPLVLSHVDRGKRMHFMVGLLILITLFILILAGIFFPRLASGQAAIEQSFSQYFNANVFRAADGIMKKRKCVPNGYWRIWTYGFHKNFKEPNGDNLEIILNWDGYFYKKGDFEPIRDWTLLK